MKREVKQLLAACNCEGKYQGKTRTMFVHGKESKETVELVWKVFGMLPFKVIAQ